MDVLFFIKVDIKNQYAKIFFNFFEKNPAAFCRIQFDKNIFFFYPLFFPLRIFLCHFAVEKILYRKKNRKVFREVLKGM
jgi:hypothetical protein